MLTVSEGEGERGRNEKVRGSSSPSVRCERYQRSAVSGEMPELETRLVKYLSPGSALSQNCSRRGKALCTPCSQIAKCELEVNAVLSRFGVSRSLILYWLCETILWDARWNQLLNDQNLRDCGQVNYTD